MARKQTCDWVTSDVRRWLEGEGFCEFWPLLSPHVPLSGQDLLSLTAEDWHRLIHESPCSSISVIKVRRLVLAISKLRPQKLAAPLEDNKESGSSPGSSSDLDEIADEDHLVEELLESSKGQQCPFCHHQRAKRGPVVIRPERWKTVLAFLYVLVVSWITAFVMVIVHDRVPDMEKYPPLPDILLDNIPHIPWAFEMCELTGMVLLVVWCVVLVFHKHRFILMRRFFSISGTIFMLRCVTMLITSLSVPGKHLECQPRPYGDVWNKLYNAYVIWTGAGMTLQGVRTCGDYMFSGHTVSLTLLNFFITEYTSRRIYFMHTFTWICNVFGVFFILAAHEHYSIDVFVAFYITSRLFMYYHTLANQPNLHNKAKREATGPALFSYEAQRTWLWFPLFSFFESSIDGKIPNEFEWPITIEHLKAEATKIATYFAKKPQELYIQTAVHNGQQHKKKKMKKK